MKPCAHDSRPAYEKLIGPLREKARELGYALGVHGSLVRDIDLIACPWASFAVSAPALAEALLIVAANVHGMAFLTPHEEGDYFRSGRPGAKPHGRIGWCIHLGGGPYIDLSVMPRAEEAQPTWVMIEEGEHDTYRELNGTLPDRRFPKIGITHHFASEKARPKLADELTNEELVRIVADRAKKAHYGPTATIPEANALTYAFESLKWLAGHENATQARNAAPEAAAIKDNQPAWDYKQGQS